jgi:hypothetical protein
LYLAEFLLGLAVDAEELFLFLAVEHEAVVIVALDVGSEFDVRDEEVVKFILPRGTSYLFLFGLEP